MNDFNQCYSAYLSEFEAYANAYMKTLSTDPSVLGESMRYSFLNGGKRIRPVLTLACADVVGIDRTSVLPYALALEMIHTYSLIHDDMPCMDNDDFRRGKPSNHKVFGEANALLAGDALLNEAYGICFQSCMQGEAYIRAASLLNECAGIRGMIVGQSADLFYTDKQAEITEEELAYIHKYKTGKLLIAAVCIPGVLKGTAEYLAFTEFGERLGLLFQITDDILDVTGDFQQLGKSIGKDAEENKWTYVKMYGLDGAKLRADLYAQDCHTVLERINGETAFLHDLIDYILRRSH